MNAITEWLQKLPGPAVYAAVAMLVFAEDALFVGFVLPGETAAVLGGVIASTSGRVQIGLMVPVVVVAAIAGDSVGYEVGRFFGPRLLDTKAARTHEARIGKAQDFMKRRGPAAVFLGRFVALFRALVPTLAGAAPLPYRKFLLYNAMGGLIWGTGFTMLGYAAGSAYARVEKVAGRVAAIVVAAVVVVALAVWSWRRHRAENTHEEPSTTPGTARTDSGGSERRGEGGRRGDDTSPACSAPPGADGRPGHAEQAGDSTRPSEGEQPSAREPPVDATSTSAGAPPDGDERPDGGAPPGHAEQAGDSTRTSGGERADGGEPPRGGERADGG